MNKQIYLYDDKIGSVEYIQHVGEDITIVNSARVSYGKEKKQIDDKDKKLISYLIKHRHTSTLEHNVVTFRFTVPLFVRSQHHRHRTWSYNEISRRYTKEDIKFYETEKLRTQHRSNRQSSNKDDIIDPVIFPDLSDSTYGVKASQVIVNHHKQSLKLFESLIARGVCREQARGVLPQNMYTSYYGTCNLNNLLKFIELRADKHAQLEIQKVALACLDIAEGLWPIAIKSYRDLLNLK